MSASGAGVELVLFGAGQRGSQYARRATRHGARVVAIADPNPTRLKALAAELGVPEEHRYLSWTELIGRGRLAKAAIIATPDAHHKDVGIACLDVGYEVLLEKPMAQNSPDARDIVAAADRSGSHLAVAHVMRYQPLTQAVMNLLGDGGIGDVVSVQHLEPIGDYHFTHSYVRGNWRNEAESSSVLLSKSCHDIDWLSHIVGSTAKRVSSFGGIYEFRAERAPSDAGERCMDCAIEEQCSFSAKRFYLGALERENPWVWPISFVTDDHTEEGLVEALRTGPFGRCVYRCDNDVLDHQAVNIEYESGVVASFVLSAFTKMEGRKTRIGGTRGHLEIVGQDIELYKFIDGSVTHFDLADAHLGAGTEEGHFGGDEALVQAFVEAVATDDWSKVITTGKESLETHEIVWAAEHARLTGTIVSMDEWASRRPIRTLPLRVVEGTP